MAVLPGSPDESYLDRGEGEPFLEDETVARIMGDDDGGADDHEPRRPLKPVDSGAISSALPVDG